MPLTGPNQPTPGWDYGGQPAEGLTMPNGGIQPSSGSGMPVAPSPGVDQSSRTLMGGAAFPTLPSNQPGPLGTVGNPSANSATTQPLQQLAAGAQLGTQQGAANWPIPPNSGVDLSMFVPGTQNIPNSGGGHWPVEFQPVNYDPFQLMAGARQQDGGQPIGGPVNNNLTMR